MKKISYIYCISILLVSYYSYAMETPTTDAPLVKIAYLGPQGTYTEQASKLLAVMEHISNCSYDPQPSIGTAIQKLVSGDCNLAVVPVENSYEGGVAATNDALWQNPQVRIRSSLLLPIRHALMCGSKQKLENICKVLSHPQALGQCTEWLEKYLPMAEQIPTSSTAAATEKLKENPTWAAIASMAAAQLYGLEVLEYPINDAQNNHTKFLLLTTGENDSVGGPISHTSIAFSLLTNAHGALLRAFEVFDKLKLNMSKIESRPSKKDGGGYFFLVDLETTTDDKETLTTALDQLQPLCERLAIFGSHNTIKISDK